MMRNEREIDMTNTEILFLDEVYTEAEEREDLIIYIYEGHKTAFGVKGRHYDFDSMSIDMNFVRLRLTTSSGQSRNRLLPSRLLMLRLSKSSNLRSLR
jgi:hypothetical protein